jgi:hypothetical protein
VQGPIRGGPFPTLNISWDPEQIGLTAGELGRRLLEGDPAIMTQAAGDGHSFLLRPVAMKPGEYQIVARRLYELFAAAPSKAEPPKPETPAHSVSGVWEVEIAYEVGTARHTLTVEQEGNAIRGVHKGWAYQGDFKGRVDGKHVSLRSTLPADGNVLTYVFQGAVEENAMSGDVRIGEYGSATWRAHRLG